MAIEKIKILGAVLELPAKQHCQFSLSTKKMGPNGLNWQCCLAGSSKTAPRILIFSMAMGADYTFELISIKTCAPQFKWHNKSFLGNVSKVWLNSYAWRICQINFIANSSHYPILWIFYWFVFLGRKRKRRRKYWFNPS